jgi:hypothetical protein
MLRKLLFSGLAALGLLTSTAFIPAAQAQDRVYVYSPYHHHHYDYHYAVIYRDYWYGPWRVYAVFHSRHAAHETAESLRFRGINARVVYR